MGEGRCDQCAFGKRFEYMEMRQRKTFWGGWEYGPTGDLGIRCRRLPETVIKKIDGWCGEFTPRPADAHARAKREGE